MKASKGPAKKKVLKTAASSLPKSVPVKSKPAATAKAGTSKPAGSSSTQKKNAKTKPVAAKKVVSEKKSVPAAKKSVQGGTVKKVLPVKTASAASKKAAAAKKPVPAVKAEPKKKPVAAKKPVPAAKAEPKKKTVAAKKPVPAAKAEPKKKVPEAKKTGAVKKPASVPSVSKSGGKKTAPPKKAAASVKLPEKKTAGPVKPEPKKNASGSGKSAASADKVPAKKTSSGVKAQAEPSKDGQGKAKPAAKKKPSSPKKEETSSPAQKKAQEASVSDKKKRNAADKPAQGKSKSLKKNVKDEDDEERKEPAEENAESGEDILDDEESKGGLAGKGGASKNDTMKTYMNEIGQIPLVSKEQEVDLAAMIHGFDNSEHDEARKTLIKANLRLVVKIAHDFKGLGLPLLDLISEGNIGLMRAVEKFDPAKGAKFSSYAAWWIKQSMRRALANQSRIIRIPVQSAGKINKIKSIRTKLAEKLGREPTDAEIAKDLDFSERTVAGLRLADLRTFSLHDPIQQGEDGEFQDIIPDRGAQTPDRILSDVESVGRLVDLLSELDERERMILKMRFGLDGNRPKTLEEVSQTIGRTRERVRQIQNQALTKLRELLQDEAGYANNE